MWIAHAYFLPYSLFTLPLPEGNWHDNCETDCLLSTSSPEISQCRLVKQNTMRGSTRGKEYTVQAVQLSPGNTGILLLCDNPPASANSSQKVLIRKWCAAPSSYLQLEPNPPRPVD